MSILTHLLYLSNNERRIEMYESADIDAYLREHYQKR